MDALVLPRLYRVPYYNLSTSTFAQLFFVFLLFRLHGNLFRYTRKIKEEKETHIFVPLFFFLEKCHFSSLRQHNEGIVFFLFTNCKEEEEE